MKLFFLVLLSFLIFSCAPSLSTQIISKKSALPENQNITVYSLNDAVPNNAIVLGNLSLGDSGFTINCDYETMIGLAKTEARKVGGNAVKITKHKLPNVFGSSCHRIDANILDVVEKNAVDIINIKETDTLNNIKPITNAISHSQTNEKLTRFILSSSFGYGYRVAQLSSSFNSFEQDYFSGLKSGFNYDLSIYYRLNSKSSYAFGIKYNVFNATN